MPQNIYTITNDIRWIDVINPSHEEMESLSKEFGLNNHTVQDCLQPQHLPKYEMIDEIHFMILRFYADNKTDNSVSSIQELTNKIAIFYTSSYLITIHKSEAEFLETIAKKYVDSKRIASVLLLLVKIIWYSLETFEDPGNKLSDEVDIYENEIMLKKTGDDQMKALYFVKHKASLTHKILMLMTEPINHQYPAKNERPAIQDMKDQYLKILTLYSQILEDVNNLMNLSMSLSAKKTNEVMRILTVFSVFFMPLTFIVGVYGMNFRYMPELNWKFGYPAVLIFMGIVTIAVYAWFKRKKWL